MTSSKGIVRLTKEMQLEADQMGMTSTEYLHWLKTNIKMETGTQNKESIPAQPTLFPEFKPAPEKRFTPSVQRPFSSAPKPQRVEAKPEPRLVIQDRSNELIEESKARIQAETELKFLKQKIEAMEGKSSHTLEGIPAQVQEQVARALMAKDFEELKKSFTKLENEYEKLEKKLEEKDKEIEELEEEKEGLQKELGLMNNLEKFVPAVVNGLSGRFPKQAGLIAEGLSGIFSNMPDSLPEAKLELSQEESDMLNLGRQLTALFPDRNEFQELLSIIAAISDKKALMPLIKQLIQRVNTPMAPDQHNQEASQENQ